MEALTEAKRRPASKNLLRTPADTSSRKNPAKKLETPINKKMSKDVLTADQFKVVLAELKSPYGLIVKSGLACALPPSELLALRLES